MSGFADGIFKGIVAADKPQAALAALPDKDLEILIENLRAIPDPNEFQASVFAMAMMEVLGRWKKSIRLVTT